MALRIALFDLDGTLVDSLEDLTDAVNATRAGFGKAPLSSIVVRGLVGKGVRNLVQRAVELESPLDVERALTLFVTFNTAHIADKSHLYPGALEALEALAKGGIRMAIISNKQEALSRLILETLGISRFFATICGGDTYPEMKPSPLPLIRVMGRFGAAPGETVMIGDSINDIQAGREAGITTIGCAWGYGELDELRQADHSAASCGELVEILLGKAQ
jgi:phosphoglycolate phosphatase